MILAPSSSGAVVGAWRRQGAHEANVRSCRSRRAHGRETRPRGSRRARVNDSCPPGGSVRIAPRFVAERGESRRRTPSGRRARRDARGDVRDMCVCVAEMSERVGGRAVVAGAPRNRRKAPVVSVPRRAADDPNGHARGERRCRPRRSEPRAGPPAASTSYRQWVGGSASPPRVARPRTTNIEPASGLDGGEDVVLLPTRRP